MRELRPQVQVFCNPARNRAGVRQRPQMSCSGQRAHPMSIAAPELTRVTVTMTRLVNRLTPGVKPTG